MTTFPSPVRKPCLDRVRRQARQLLATTASSWNLAVDHVRAQAASAGSEPLGCAQAPRHFPAL